MSAQGHQTNCASSAVMANTATLAKEDHGQGGLKVAFEGRWS